MEEYKKKLTLAKERYNNPKISEEEKKFIEQIFPELIESEDEKVRKELYKYFHDLQLSNDREFSPSTSIDEILAWLEKQGEQKPTWSEEDEKMISLLIKIFEVNHPNEHFKVNPIGTTNMESISTKEIVDWLQSIKPQQNQYDKGYKDGFSAANFNQCEQKPTWSEEEKTRIDRIINVLDWAEEKGRISYSDWEDYVTYVKSLKPQNKQNTAWNEEDDYTIEKLFYLLDNEQDNYPQLSCDFQEIEGIKDWLKSIKDRVQLQSKKVWSDENLKFINELCNLLAAIAKDNYIGGYYVPDLINKIQSLKPQNKWKPSEEQLQALKHYVDTTMDGEIELLYNDLLKL